MNISPFFSLFDKSHCPCCIFSIVVLAFKYSCKWMEEARGVGVKERKARGGWQRREREGEWEGAKTPCGGGGCSLTGVPCGGIVGIQEWRREGISRRPHDLFRPGGTCASQTLMAAITLPTRWCLNRGNLKKRQTNLWQRGKLL